MRVLIAEDDPVSRRLLQAFLTKWGYDVVVTSDGREAWEELQKKVSPNLVISDWMMPYMDGVELCRKIREMERRDYIYFIILTAKGRKEDIVSGLESGADDYLVKPFDREEMRYRVQIGERIIALEQGIRQMACTDSLTGVLNRRAFMERIEDEIERSYRERAPLALILSDIDYFKNVNDKSGHLVGDLVLQRFAEQLAGATRQYDFLGRYGGEEFVVCAPGVETIQARFVAERMRKKVQEMKILPPNFSHPVKITASFGVACLQLESRETVDSLTGRADEALYQAKKEGRNRVCTADED
jgi:two-component system cell cycle response regulator